MVRGTLVLYINPTQPNKPMNVKHVDVRKEAFSTPGNDLMEDVPQALVPTLDVWCLQVIMIYNQRWLVTLFGGVRWWWVMETRVRGRWWDDEVEGSFFFVGWEFVLVDVDGEWTNQEINFDVFFILTSSKGLGGVVLTNPMINWGEGWRDLMIWCEDGPWWTFLEQIQRWKIKSESYICI